MMDRNKKIHFIQRVFLLIFFLGAGNHLFAEPLEKIAKKISAGAKELQNKKVAVLPFPYHDGRESQGSTIISERLITKLVEQKKLDVIERSLMEKVLKELKLQASGAIDEQSAKQIGKILGVEAIVSGTLIDLGEKEVEVNARLIKTETGQILVATSGKVERFWQDETVTASSQEEKKSLEQQPLAPAPPDSGAAPQTSESFPAMAPPREQPPMDEPEEENEKVILKGPPEMVLFETDTGHELDNPVGQQILQGFQLLKRGKGAEAQSHFTTLYHQLKDRPKLNSVIRLGYSLSLFEQGKQEKAFRYAQEVAEQKQFPKVSAMAHFILGRYAEKSGKPELAKEQYLKVLRVSPFQTPLVKKAGQRLEMLNGGGPMFREKMQERMERMRERMRRKRMMRTERSEE